MTGTGYPDWQPPGYLGAKHMPGTGYPDWQPPGYVAAPAGGVVRLHQPFTEADWTEEYAFPFLTPEIKLLAGGGIEWTKAQVGTVAGILLLEEGKWIGSAQTLEHSFATAASSIGCSVGFFMRYFDTTHYMRSVDRIQNNGGQAGHFQILEEKAGATTKESGAGIGGGWYAGNPKRWQRSILMPGYVERGTWPCDPELAASAGRPALQVEVGGNLSGGGGTNVEPPATKETLGVMGVGGAESFAGSVGWVVINPPAGFTIKSYKATSMGLFP